MQKRRFIRDNALDGLISDLQLLLVGIDQSDPSAESMTHYINSLLVAFKTDKEVMLNVELAIVRAKESGLSDDIISPLADAMIKMQTGILYLHRTLLKNTEQLREQYDIPCDYSAE